MLRSECETAQLIHCAETGDAANLRRLLGHYGLTRDYSHIPYSRTVLHRACIAGQRECVVELLKAGADPNEVDDNRTVTSRGVVVATARLRARSGSCPDDARRIFGRPARARDFYFYPKRPATESERPRGGASSDLRYRLVSALF